MQALLLKWRELVYICFGENKKKNISELIEDSDTENTKRQRKYAGAVSRMYLKNSTCICEAKCKRGEAI